MSSSGGSISRYVGSAPAAIAAILVAAAAAVVAPVVTGGSGSVSCDQTLSTGANVETTLAAATAGSTICLNAGTYTYTAAEISKASPTTVTAANGVAQSAVTLHGSGGTTDAVNLGASNNLTFKGITITGVTVGNGFVTTGTNGTNLLFQHVHLTGCNQINEHGTGQMNVTFDGDMADVGVFGTGASQPCNGEARFDLVKGSENAGTGLKGLVIENMKMPGSHCSDGVQGRNDFVGAQIGPGNEFYGIRQNSPNATDGGPSCTSHVDPYQPLDSSYGLFTGNWVHNDSTGVMGSDDGNSNNTITNNVFDERGSASSDWPYHIYAAWTPGSTVSHNVFLADSANTRDLFVNDWAGGTAPHTDLLAQDNVFVAGGIVVQNGAVVTHDHNLNSGLSETGGLTGTPTFVGGTNPTTWAGYALSCPGSVGCGGAHDGTNLGIQP